MGVDVASWAKAFSERITEKVKHVYDMVDQKLEYQHKYLEQRLEALNSVQSEKLLNFSVRLEEALAEIRGYKDILQQQLTVVDSATKRAHERIDELSTKNKEALVDLQRSIERMTEHAQQQSKETTERLIALDTLIKEARKSIAELEQAELIESTQKQTLKEDPVRKFLGDNAQKILLFVITGIAIYVLRNLGSVIQSFTP